LLFFFGRTGLVSGSTPQESFSRQLAISFFNKNRSRRFLKAGDRVFIVAVARGDFILFSVHPERDDAAVAVLALY
jgi:hypothetical protein